MKKTLPLFLTIYSILISVHNLSAQNFNKSPILITPEENWDVTKEALSFRYVAPDDDDFINIISNNYSINKSGSSVNLKLHNKQQAVYRIQIATSRSFTTDDIKYNKHIKMWSRQHGTTQHIPNISLSAGIYFWRMRCEVIDNGTTRKGPWSTEKKLKLVTVTEATNKRYNISNINPLMVLADVNPNRIFSNDSDLFSDFGKNAFSKNDFTEDKRKHVAVVIDDRAKSEDRFSNATTYSLNTLKNNLNKIKNWGYKTLTFHQYSLAEQDWMYKNYDNCIGTYTGETEDLVRFYQDGGNDTFNSETYRYLVASLKLAKIHGGYFMNATHYADNALVSKDHEPFFHSSQVNQLLTNYGDGFILGTKNNSPKAKHLLESYNLGLWLDEKIGNMCTWVENYYNRQVSTNYNSLWPSVSSNERDTYTPITQMAKEILYTASSGSTVFVLRDNDNSTNQAKNRSVLRDHIYKLFEMLVDEKMIPSRNQVRAKKTQSLEFITIAENGSRDTSDSKTFYQKYETLYHHLFKIKAYDKEKVLTDVIPDNGGKYGVFPITSKFGNTPEWTVDRLKLSDVNTTTKTENLFTKTAPHTGTAWVSKNQNRYIILNSLETNKREDDLGNLIKHQTYNIPLDNTKFINKLKGSLNFSTYIAAKTLDDGNRLKMFVNSHRYDQYVISNNVRTVDLNVETTTIVVFTDNKPNVTVTPSSALISADWNSTKKKMVIKIQQNDNLNNIVSIDVAKLTLPSIALSKNEILNIKNNVGISPNPATNQITINGKFNHWSIKNMSGKILKKGTKKSININHLNRGIYLVVIDNYKIKKLIVK